MPPKDRYYYAPWERVLEQISTPFEEFLHRQTTIGILLLICAAVALFIANSPLADTYHSILATYVSMEFGTWKISHSLHHWINDGLMALFFYVVGLEIKREILVGELSDLQNAVLPIVAAVGGMVVPALFYFAVNTEGPGVVGWGIPMATDIAFAVGVMALLGDRVPKALLTFLVALAIVDDLGAVSVIAIFYTDSIDTQYLAAAGAIFAGLVALNLSGVRRVTPYFCLAVFLWIAMEGSGVHATIAGILGAMATPAYSRMKPGQFSSRMRQQLDDFDEAGSEDTDLLGNPKQQKALWQLEHSLSHAVAPSQVLESRLHIPVTYLVIPAFALANAGIDLDMAHIKAAVAEPITLGIVLGLVVGKVLGVAGFSLLALKFGFGRLPEGVNARHIAGAGMLSGIGFTMSIFIAELAFPGNLELVNHAKTGILAASLLAGLAGYAWLRFVASER